MTEQDQLQALRDEVATLRAELTELQRPRAEETVSRRHLLRNLAGLGAAGAAGMVAAAPPAAAADGDPLILGQANTATAITTIDAGSAAAGLDVQGSGFSVINVSGSGGTLPIHGITATGEASGVWGQSEAVGVFGRNTGMGPGIGGSSMGGGPQLWLAPTDGAPPGPPPGTSSAGYVRFDANGDLWLCIQDGTPGSWTRLLREDTAPGRVVPITPFRALDTRAPGGRPAGAPAIPGQVQGPLSGGGTTTLDLAGSAGIPATASGAVGNVSAVAPTYSGFLKVQPAGVAVLPSTLNFPAGVRALSNGFTCALSPTGLSVVPSPGSGGNTLHVVLDITAYIT
jgi:hypothetical protein